MLKQIIGYFCFLSVLSFSLLGRENLGSPIFTICADTCDFSHIQQALDAQEVPAGAVLTVADAIHTESGIIVAKDVTIQGEARLDHPIIQTHESAKAAKNRIFTVQEGVTVVFNNLTLRHGRAPYAYPPSGGAICNYGTLTLEDCVVTHNRATDGGAVLNKGTLTILDSTFAENTADGVHPDLGLQCGSGGAIKAETGQLTMRRTTLHHNTASEKGGGVYVSCKSTVTITESTLHDNTASQSGGGIHVRGSLYLTNSKLYQNRSPGLGGGLFIHGKVAFSQNRLTDNTRYDCYLMTEHPYKEDGVIVENADNTIAEGNCSE
jgi:hypothetical protein